jgi:hypothetical protein
MIPPQIRLRIRQFSSLLAHGQFPTRECSLKHIAQRGYFVGRFVFRYSIVDLADARQKRVSGPISTVVCAGMAASPFVRANTINFGSGEYATVAVNPAASVGAVSVWHEKAHATRRPL